MDFNIDELVEMLAYCRPHGSLVEEEFIQNYLEPLEVISDDFGNRYKFVGVKENEHPDILWSSHTDTVHKKEGSQEVIVDRGFATVKDNNCLGADCTTGVWLMMNMIRAGIPGAYVFHRAEEVGTKGSEYISQHFATDIVKFKAAIAFDRCGYDSIITHQMGERCCSESFSESLKKALSMGDLESDPTGSYTDTYSYIRQIPECTNLSVGYFNQHTSKESQDLDFVEHLQERLLKIDLSQLVYVRDPKIVEYDYGDDWISRYYGSAYEQDKKDGTPYWDQELNNMAEMVRMWPEEVARILIDMNISEEDIMGTVAHSYSKSKKVSGRRQYKALTG